MSLGLLRSGSPRRAPWPYDLTLAGITGITGTTGFILGKKDKEGSLIAKKATTQTNVQPTEFSYAAQNPNIEQTFVWDDWSLGVGLQNQRTQHDRRYRGAGSCDASIGGQLIPGPQITYLNPATRDTVNGVTHFFEIAGILYALNGRYCLKRVDDTSWTVSKDFGSGKVALDVVVFKQNIDGGGSTTYAFVAMGDAEKLYRFDGTTWTQHATLFALAFCIVGTELYRANDINHLSKVDTNADPWTAGNWSAANSFFVGDNSSVITRLTISAAGVLLIFKTDGIYVLDELGNDIHLYTGLGFYPAASNGKAFCRYEDYVYVVYNDQMFRIAADLSIEPIGPERALEGGAKSTANAGYVTSCVGTPYALYAGTTNRDTSPIATLYKFGAWVRDESGGLDRIDAWHGDLSDGLGAGHGPVTALGRSTIGAPTSHERLYLGREDGSLAWFPLPCVANPLACSSYIFDPDGSFYIAMPYWNGGYPTDAKHLRSITVSGENITATNFLRIGVDGVFKDYTSNVIRRDLATDTKTVRGNFEFQATEDSQTTPFVIHSVSVQFAVRPTVLMTWEFSILAENGLVRRDGSIMRIGADRIRAVLEAAADDVGSATVVTSEETSTQMDIVDLQEGFAWSDRTQQWHAAFHVTAVEAAKGDLILVT